MDWGTMEAVVNKLGGLEGVGRFLRGEMEIVTKRVEEKSVLLPALIKTTATQAVTGKKTSDCFTNTSRYYYRDEDLDCLLPSNQFDQTDSRFSVLQLTENSTFKRVVERFLGVTGDIAHLSQTLKERGHTTTLPTIESLIERQEAGEDVGIRTDGRGNFFFVEGYYGGVLVIRVDRDRIQWQVSLYRLGFDFTWNVNCRFFFRN